MSPLRTALDNIPSSHVIRCQFGVARQPDSRLVGGQNRDTRAPENLLKASFFAQSTKSSGLLPTTRRSWTKNISSTDGRGDPRKSPFPLFL